MTYIEQFRPATALEAIDLAEQAAALQVIEDELAAQARLIEE